MSNSVHKNYTAATTDETEPAEEVAARTTKNRAVTIALVSVCSFAALISLNGYISINFPPNSHISSGLRLLRRAAEDASATTSGGCCGKTVEEKIVEVCNEAATTVKTCETIVAELKAANSVAIDASTGKGPGLKLRVNFGLTDEQFDCIFPDAFLNFKQSWKDAGSVVASELYSLYYINYRDGVQSNKSLVSSLKIHF